MFYLSIWYDSLIIEEKWDLTLEIILERLFLHNTQFGRKLLVCVDNFIGLTFNSPLLILGHILIFYA